jgi:hypothetical protein
MANRTMQAKKRKMRRAYLKRFSLLSVNHQADNWRFTEGKEIVARKYDNLGGPFVDTLPRINQQRIRTTTYVTGKRDQVTGIIKQHHKIAIYDFGPNKSLYLWLCEDCYYFVMGTEDGAYKSITYPSQENAMAAFNSERGIRWKEKSDEIL